MGSGSKPGERRGGREKGTPNAATAQARKAIAAIAEGMAAEFEGWLRTTADGVVAPLTPEEIKAGELPKYLVKPDPRGAADLYLKAIEYHIPKLARVQLSGDPDNPLVPPAIVIPADMSPMDAAELYRLALGPTGEE